MLFLKKKPQYSITQHAVLGTAILFLAVNFLTSGYGFGYGEQMLLSVKGISWADPNAFVGDWFNNYAPQPHVLFDVITYFGEKIHFLAGIYFMYYITCCFVFALATSLLAEKWLPQNLKYLQHLVNVLCVVGPYFLLGTFLTIHLQAVPNMAGGCMAYLSIALLLTRRDNWSALAIVGTSCFHLQHGIAIATIAILFVVFGLTKKKVQIVVASLVALGISFATAFYRDILSGSSEIAQEAAEIGSTGHLNVETWSTSSIRWGLFVLALAVLHFATTNEKRVQTAALFSLVALGPVVGIVADLNNIEPFQSLARSYFIYRYSMVLAPFACWFLVCRFVQINTARKPTAFFSAFIAIFGIASYLSVTYGQFSQLRSAWILIGFAALGITLRWNKKEKFNSMNWSFVAVAYLVVSAIFMGFQHFGSRWPSIDYAVNDNAVTISRSMGTALLKNDVLASDPSIPWIRLLTRRAIVADCKGVPYGGKAWDEYLRRLALLGVDAPNVCMGFKTLSLEKLLTLPNSVGATTVLLMPDDIAYKDAKQNLAVRWSSGGQNPWIIFELPPVN